ncbi:hypothetical protein AVEN_185750-1 [Araneus ventricosus]|uniref:Uncharacterized protein n=1 Tax=Araneus ventricosus TaxID=182803 RepID=A0A4Y2KI16_ARAVE|nr:hypothetical protein AVEN_185750-1 [Araneus ventricosus]
MNDKRNAKPDESVIVMQATNSINIIGLTRTTLRNNNYQTPTPRQTFRPFSNANTHFQDKLPPSTCWLCTKQGIANAYHWVQTCPSGLSAGQLPFPNPAPPNFDPPKEENQQWQLPTTTEDQGKIPQSVTENKCELRKEVKYIIKNFDSVFSKDKNDVGALRVEPQRIVLNSDLPVSLRPYRTSPVEEQEIKSQVDKLLQAGLIKESNSPYSSPVTLVFKPDEGKRTRLSIDFRKLNALCKSDSEPLPLMDSLLDKLSKAIFFPFWIWLLGVGMCPFTQKILKN